MRIDIPAENVIYIELNGYTYYIDDSTEEQIIEVFETDSLEELRKIKI
jgi:hypothetical protein